jgi:cysteine synthase A
LPGDWVIAPASFVRAEETPVHQSFTMLNAIGHSATVELHTVVPAEAARIVVKLESQNPTGSYKDRMAKAIIEAAERRGDLQPGMTVVEYTGGSTGSSLAFVCAVKGYRLIIVTSDAFAPEKLRTIAAFGAELVIVPSEAGMITPDLIPRMRERASDIARAEGAFATDQFNNRDAFIGYHNIATELIATIPEPITTFCGGVGTAGMLMGVAEGFRRSGQPTSIVGFEPASSPVISSGTKGSHHIEGVGVGFRPPLLDDDLVAEIRPIEEDEARSMARRLAREEGLLAGTSTGMNVAGAILLAQELGPQHVVATVAADTGLKYLSGDLFQVDD